MSLQTGQALLFSPGSLLLARSGEVKPLGTGYLKIRTRPRITSDGGVSVFAAGAVVTPQAAVKSKGSTVLNTTVAIATKANAKLDVVRSRCLFIVALLTSPN
jgi:hypothetical protein